MKDEVDHGMASKMGIGLAELLDMHRAHYLDHFVQSMGKWSGGMAEALLEWDRYAPSQLYKLFRGDYVREVKGEVRLTTFDLNGPLEHAIFLEQRGEFTVEVRPFCWNECVFQVLCERFDRQALEAWAEHWLDTEESRGWNADGLREVIHRLSPPTYPLGKLTFFVDFGTAPVRAVLELVQIFQMEQGSSRFIFGVEV
jgi:hypothetical protein